MRKMRIAFWKWRLKIAYLNYVDLQDEYDCGNKLLHHVSGTLAALALKINVLIRKLKTLDHTCKLKEIIFDA